MGNPPVDIDLKIPYIMIVVHTLLMACRQFGDRAVRHFIKMKGNEMKKFIVGIALSAALMGNVVNLITPHPTVEQKVLKAPIFTSIYNWVQWLGTVNWGAGGYNPNMPPYLQPDYNN